jgi:hypothetical protein
MMWQADATDADDCGSTAADRWQYDRIDVAITWSNQGLTRVIIWLVGKGATWPSQGLPRGTPLLVDVSM